MVKLKLKGSMLTGAGLILFFSPIILDTVRITFGLSSTLQTIGAVLVVAGTVMFFLGK